MTQPELFPVPAPRPPQARARRTDPATSHAAAADVERSGAAAGQRRAVLDAVRRAPGLTSDELAAEMGVSRNLPARRLCELERAGLVRRGDPRPSRLTGRRGLTYFST